MDTALSKYDEPLNLQHNPPRPIYNSLQLPSYLTLRQNMANSTEYWLKHSIKSVSLPPRKIYSYLPPVMDALGLRMPDVYSIQCECGPVYTG